MVVDELGELKKQVRLTLAVFELSLVDEDDSSAAIEKGGIEAVRRLGDLVKMEVPVEDTWDWPTDESGPI